MSDFKDHFSGHAQQYGQYRPSYPESLYRYLASISPANHYAWDCATGSGQAAVGLAHYFDKVIATDASEQQLQHAIPHERVQYKTAGAENSGIETSSIDLITVAQALHWFDLDAFYAEAHRVLVSEGILAVWTYSLFHISPEIDQLILHLYRDIVGEYWPPERVIVEQAYQTIPFPFEEITPPELHMESAWDLDRVLGYLRTWSAVQRYIKQNRQDPVDMISNDLHQHWGDATQIREIVWPLSLRVGRYKTGA